MQFKMMKTSKLIEHPRNKEFFTDISDSTPALWQAFKENIKDYGIIEPLLVEKGTNNVRSGNQRLKAAIELSMAEVPVVIVDAEIDDEELGILAGEIEDGKIVSSNVFRRNVDNFKMFELIGVLRKGATGKPGPPKVGSESLSKKNLAKELGKSAKFVSAAELYNGLEPDEQEDLQEWFDKKANRSDGELIAQLQAMEAGSIESDRRYEELVDLSATAEERLSTLDKMLEERDSQIAELTDVDYEGEIEDRDARIVALELEKTNLTQALKEVQERPDLNLFLSESVKRQKETNSVLKEIVEHRDLLNVKKLEDLVKTVARTVKILESASVDGRDDSTPQGLIE